MGTILDAFTDLYVILKDWNPQSMPAQAELYVFKTQFTELVTLAENTLTSQEIDQSALLEQLLQSPVNPPRTANRTKIIY